MDVNFPRAVIESVDPDILFQEMVEYQKNLNSGYNDELNMTAGAFEGLLHAHLEEEHPGLEIPPNSSYFQVMRNTFEELALLIGEMEDMNGKHRRFIWANRQGQDEQYKMNSAKLSEMRLDFERCHRTLTLKFHKLLDLAMMNASASGGVEGEEADTFLGILRKGMLFVIWRSFRGMLRVLWEMGEGWKEMIKRDDQRVHAFLGRRNEVGGGPSKTKRKKKKARKIIAVIGAIDVKL